MFNLGLGKYRTIIILIALFLVFDVGVLGLTFVISNQIASDAVSLNIAGEQRTLVQQLTKSALLLEQEATQGTIDSSGKSSFSELRELISTADRFNATLEAFHAGGTRMASGAMLALTPQDDEQAAAYFKQLEELWAPVNQELDVVRQQKDKADLGPVLQVLVQDNLNLLTISSMLAERLETLSAAKAAKLRMVQVAGITLALINFVFILYTFLGQLRRSDLAVEEAHKETDNILRTTQEGLFLLDTDFRIGKQTSQALAKILGVGDVSGQNFLDLLKPLVSPKTYDTTKEYIELLMRHEVKEKLVASLNPLDCIEITNARAGGVVEIRYLQVRFNRVMEAGRVTHLLVTANDITRRVKLERELKESERKVQEQMGMMVRILQADPRMLQEFLTSAIAGLDSINQELKSDIGSADEGARRIAHLFRIAHRMKGDATALALEALAQSLHSFEELLSDMRAKAVRNSEDFLPVTVRVKGLYIEVNAIREALTKISQVRASVESAPVRLHAETPAAAQVHVQQWRQFAHQVAERQGKQIELGYEGMDLSALDAGLNSALNTIVNQFIRNAVTHGVELPEIRRVRGKSATGHLAVYISETKDGNIELSFRDDGAGLNMDKLRQAAVRNGRLSEEEARQADMKQLVSLIFEPGISTSDKTSEDAGRGVGLDAVKELVTRMGGRVRINTSPGESCVFRVQLPRHSSGDDRTVVLPRKEAA